MTEDEPSEILLPSLVERQAFLEKGGRLVHYTSAEAGFKIINNREIWLRNSLLMNDFSEIQHGHQCLLAAWNSERGIAFQEWLDTLTPGLKAKLVEIFDAHTPGMKVATFMTSLSEHDDDEDDFGRLSMWRAYGGRNGVALVLNPTIFNSATDELKVYSSPVSYQSVDSFVSDFQKWADHLQTHADKIKSADPDSVLSFLFYAFRVFVLCTKHPGFREEREWRVFHSPLLDGTSDWLTKENEIIAGVPQEVIKIALRDDENLGITGVGPGSLLNRVIIGPSAYPTPTYHALYNALSSAEITNPAEVLWTSNIPIRN